MALPTDSDLAKELKKSPSPPTISMFALPSAVASTSAWSLAMSLFAAMAAMASSKLFSSCMRNSFVLASAVAEGIQGAELLAKPLSLGIQALQQYFRFRAALVLGGPGGRAELLLAAPGRRASASTWLRPGRPSLAAACASSTPGVGQARSSSPLASAISCSARTRAAANHPFPQPQR